MPDVYVLAYHPVFDDTADHRDPRQWRFYVIVASALPATKSISLGRLRALADDVGMDGLRESIGALVAT